MYNFYLYHSSFDSLLRIEDPVGWDGLGKTLRRDRALHGITFEYTPKLKFIKKGRAVIQQIYESEGIEGELYLIVRVLDPLSRKYTEDYKGRVNFTSLQVSELYAECNIENTGFLQKFMNRREVVVDLLASESLDGQQITPPAPEIVELHSKVLVKAFEPQKIIQEGDTSALVVETGIAPGSYFITDAVTANLDEIEERFTYPLGLSGIDPIDSDKYMFLLKEAGTYRFTIRFDLSVHNVSAPLGTFALAWTIKAGDNPPVTVAFDEDQSNAGLAIFNVDMSTELDLKKGDQVYSYGVLDITGIDDASNYSISQTWQLSSYRIEGDTIVPATDCPLLLPHEALTQMVGMITGSDGAFYSDYFGRTDLGYAVDGPGALRSTTSGKHVRGFPIDEFGIFGDFDTYRKSLDVTDGIGVGLDLASDGRQRVRVEKEEFFYQAQLLARFDYVPEIGKKVDESAYYNELEVGFKKWANEQINNLDEFLTRRQHVLPVTQIKRKLSLISEIIGSGYTLEFVRRDRYAASNTKDNNLDNELFFVQLRREDEQLITDRDQDYDQVDGLISPETSYNLKLRISEMIVRRRRQLASMLYLLKKEITPTFSEGNDKLQIRTDPGGALISDNRIIDAATLDSPLFIPEIYTIEVPVTTTQKRSIEANPYGYIEFSKTDKDHKKGYLLLSQPDQKTRLTTFELLKARL